MTKCEVSPLKTNFLNTHAEPKAIITLKAYIKNIILAPSSGAKNAPMNKANTGSLAPQIINGVTIIVINLSFLLSSVRDAMIPGTAQPFVDIIIGKNDFP